MIATPQEPAPRRRVRDALNHRQPDRVPVDFSAHRSSGIAAVAYPRLRSALGLPPAPVRVYDPVQQLAIVDEDVLERFGVDAIELGRGFAAEDHWWTDWVLPDGAPCRMPAWAGPRLIAGEWVLLSPEGRAIGRMPRDAFFFEQTWWPFLESEDLSKLPEALAAHMWSVAAPPGPSAPDDCVLAQGARRFHEATPRAVVGLFGGNLFEAGHCLYRLDNFMMMLAGEPARAHAFLDRLLELRLERLEKYLAAVGPHIEVILFGDDLGGQNGPLISPKMYREFFKHRHAAMWKRSKELVPGVKVMLHCCGAIRPLLPDLIEAGVDAVNPVQISGRGMEAAGLKRDFGRDITFWGGGCDTQSVLPLAAPPAVRKHVLGQLDTLAPGGGFVFQQVHNIQANVPPENVIAMFDAVREFNECGAARF